MGIFHMLVGLPASGKSTISKILSKDYGGVIHSSDELRKELFGSYYVFDKNEELFDELHKRIIDDLKYGKNVIYDATNLSMKNRRKILNTIPNGIEKQAIVVGTTINDCLIRDSKRNKKVGNEVILRMWKKFQFPLKREGFDEVRIIYNSKYDWAKNLMNYVNCSFYFNQDNPNHSLNLGEHMSKSMELYSYDTMYDNEFYNKNILIALQLHDIGKLWTKQFNDKRGNKTDIAHYYDHHNVSAYQLMFMLDDIAYDKKYIIQLVNYHMQLYFIKTEKSEKKWINIFGEEMYNDLTILNKYDRLAH